VRYPEERPLGHGRDLDGRRKDGTSFPVEIALNPVELEGGTCVIASIVDISKRKQVEKALDESEDKLALLLESTAEGIFGIDLEARCTFSNLACLRMLGYQRSDELIGKNMHDLIHHTRPDGTPYPARECPVLKALQGGEGAHIENEVLWRADGTSFHVEYWSNPQRREGLVVGAVVTFIDITARRRTEEALKKSQEKFSKAFRESPMALTLTSAKDHRYIEVNETFQRLTGYSREEVLGRTPFELKLWKDPSQRLGLLKRLLGEGSIRNVEVTIRTKDGRTLVGLASAELMEIHGAQFVLAATVDITDRKRAEQALRESEEKFRRVFQDAAAGMVMISPDLRFRAANRAFCQFIGYPEQELIGRDVAAIAHPEDQAISLQLLEEAHAAGSGSHQLEKRYLHKDGHVLWGELSTTLIQDSAGNADYFVSQVVDITARKQSEEALRKSEEKFSKVFRESPAAITLTSAKDHRYIEVNETFERITGYSRKEVLGRTPLELGIWVDPSKRAEFVKRLLSEGSIRDYEFAFRIKDGSVRIGLGSAELIEIDGEQLVLWAVADITERRYVQESLRESEERFRRVVEHIGDALFVDDVDGHIVFANERFLNLFGFGREELQNVTLEDYVAPEYRAQLRDRHNRRMRGEVVPSHFEYEGVRRGDGRRLWLEVDVVPVEDQTGKLVGTQSALRDITERKRVEDALRQRQAELKEAQRLAQLGNWVWELRSDVITWSDELYRIHGRALDTPLPLLKELPQFFTPESWSRLSSVMQKGRTTGVVDDLELEVIRPDGSKRWVATRGEAVRDASGAVVQLRGTIQDITERRRAEQELRESEERFRLLANAAPVMIWKSGPDKLCTYFNQPWLEFTGRALEAELGNGWTEGVHPDDLLGCMDTYTQSFEFRVAFKMEYRLRRHDGEYRWIEDTGIPMMGPDGSFAGYIGSCADITDRKKGEEALRTVSGKLIEAQEKERRHIARELHDDINQRLALLAIELQQLSNISSLSDVQLHERTQELFKRTTEISTAVQLLSHGLHSSSLEYLGLVPGIRGFCAEFAKHHKVHIDFVHRNLPTYLPPDVALGLFRVLQEALHNAVKHSGAPSIEVLLLGVDAGLQLTVRDAGKGFDPEVAMGGQGLGLISMRERVNLLKGTISISSQPSRGTSIVVFIPAVAKMDASKQASA
jgi:PAS domain S-box-containing protein